MEEEDECRPLYWVGGSYQDLKKFPERVMDVVGYSLYMAQIGRKSEDAKPLKGFGSGVLEIIADHNNDTYRAVYTVRLATGVYVLHCFQKKSKHGIETPKKEIDLIKQRLKWAIEQDRERKG